jgi:hypothetical protein
MTRRTGLLIVIAAATVIYLPSLHNGFAYDDVAIIQADERVHSLSDMRALIAKPYWHDPEMGLYRPLVTLNYAVDWVVSGGSAHFFHAVNVVWNAIACGALFLLLAALLPVGAALAGALIFAVHPLHVEAVANVVGRAELIAGALMFIALNIWIRNPAGAALARGRLALIAVLFALALLSKESAIMLPALIVLVDVARRALLPSNVMPWLRTHAAALVTLTIVAVAYLVLRMMVLGELGPARLAAALEVVGPYGQRLTALQIWPHILRLLFFPTMLLADYAPRIIMPATSWTGEVVLGATLLFAMLAGGVMAWRRGNGLLAMTLLWLPVALLPVSNLVIPIGVLIAERALYLPSAALAFAVSIAIASIAEVRATRLAFVATALAAIALSVRTVTRIPDWDNTDAVFAAQLRDRPDSYAAVWHEARLAVRANDPARALDRYGQAMQLWPHRKRLVLEAAGQGARFGNLGFARQVSGWMFERWPDDIDAARMFASTALDQGDTIAARAALDRALRMHPADSLLRRMRAAIQPDSAS